MDVVRLYDTRSGVYAADDKNKVLNRSGYIAKVMCSGSDLDIFYSPDALQPGDDFTVKPFEFRDFGRLGFTGEVFTVESIGFVASQEYGSVVKEYLSLLGDYHDALLELRQSVNNSVKKSSQKINVSDRESFNTGVFHARRLAEMSFSIKSRNLKRPSLDDLLKTFV